MNYLAHTLFSKNTIDYQVANLVADALKGKAWAGCSQHHLDGLAMHKAIDSFTDASPHVQQAKNRLGSGYLKGVIIDIVFDHFVVKHWSRFVTVDFEEFVQQFYTRAEQQRTALPNVGAAFLDRVIRYDFFHLYGDINRFDHILEKLNQRLSDKILAKESASDYFPRVIAEYDAIEADFLMFFPTLIELFLTRSQATEGEHYFQINQHSDLYYS